MSELHPVIRPRRLRQTPAMRRLVAETRLHPAELILPLFVREGATEPVPIGSMPGVSQHSLDSLKRVANEAAEAGVGGLMLFGVTTDPWGLNTGVEVFGIPLGVILGVLAVLLGAYSLVLDFDFIQKGAANRIPKKYQWTGAFGIMVTVIWLYLEILRLIAIMRR